MSSPSCPSQLLHRSRRDTIHSMAFPWSCKSKKVNLLPVQFSVTFQRKFQRNKIYILTANILLSLPKNRLRKFVLCDFSKSAKERAHLERYCGRRFSSFDKCTDQLRKKTSSVLEAHKIPWTLRLIKMMISDINRHRYRLCYRYPDLSLLFFVLKVAININCSPGEMTVF